MTYPHMLASAPATPDPYESRCTDVSLYRGLKASLSEFRPGYPLHLVVQPDLSDSGVPQLGRDLRAGRLGLPGDTLLLLLLVEIAPWIPTGP